jgi:biopolymer transport protein ExbD
VSEVSGTGSVTPDERPPPEADFHDVVVRILWSDGRVSWRVGEDTYNELNGVEQRLALIFRANDEAPVIIDPDDEAPFGNVIEVYDLSRQVGFREVKLAASDQA